MPKRQSPEEPRALKRSRPQLSPLGQLARNMPDDLVLAGLASTDSVFMLQLGDQFASALADNKLEAALAMLAGCPALARMPCRKALFSALHWTCASSLLAPATRALLLLGCDPLGYPDQAHAGSERSSSSPIRWAISSGNLASLLGLLEAGAPAGLEDLYEACRNAEGSCASAILRAFPHLNPFEPIAPGSKHCFDALLEAAASHKSLGEAQCFAVESALAFFERRALEAQTPPIPTQTDPSSETSGETRRL